MKLPQRLGWDFLGYWGHNVPQSPVYCHVNSSMLLKIQVQGNGIPNKPEAFLIDPLFSPDLVWKQEPSVQLGSYEHKAQLWNGSSHHKAAQKMCQTFTSTFPISSLVIWKSSSPVYWNTGLSAWGVRQQSQQCLPSMRGRNHHHLSRP